jgi:hypothetical protein
MTRRRAARRNRRNWIAAAAIVLAVLFFARAYSALAVIAAAALAAAIIGARWAARPRPVKRRPQRRQAAPWANPRPVTPPQPRTARGDARARRNGWIPPAAASTRTVAISDECAEDSHVFCAGTGCACPCNHDPRVIAAINEARYTAPDIARPPADTGPIPF